MVITQQDLYVLKKLKRMDDIAKSRRKPIAKEVIKTKNIRLKIHSN